MDDADYTAWQQERAARMNDLGALAAAMGLTIDTDAKENLRPELDEHGGHAGDED